MASQMKHHLGSFTPVNKNFARLNPHALVAVARVWGAPVTVKEIAGL
jgi:hypothetical protein